MRPKTTQKAELQNAQSDFLFFFSKPRWKPKIHPQRRGAETSTARVLAIRPIIQKAMELLFGKIERKEIRSQTPNQEKKSREFVKGFLFLP